MKRALLLCAMMLGFSALASASQPYVVASRYPSDAPAKIYYAFIPPVGVGPGGHAYVTVLGYVPNCNGAHACAYATITVLPHQPLGKGTAATLGDGTQAVYVAPKCGSTPYCSDGTLRFNATFGTVEVAKSMGTLAQLRALAESLHPAAR